MEFVDYKCLESLLIEGEKLIATEGLLDKLKERRKTKKDAREQKYQQITQDTKNAISEVKQIAVSVMNKTKIKYKSLKIKNDIDVIHDNVTSEVNIEPFYNDYIGNEYVEGHDPKYVECWNYIISTLKDELNKKNFGAVTARVEVIENGIITISIKDH